MGFFHCKIVPGEKKKISKSFNRKLQKKKIPKCCQLGSRHKAQGKMNKNGQILSKKNDSSSMGRALHHLRAGLGKDHGAKPSTFSQLWGCKSITCPSPPQAPGSPMVPLGTTQHKLLPKNFKQHLLMD